MRVRVRGESEGEQVRWGERVRGKRVRGKRVRGGSEMVRKGEGEEGRVG